jgi:zinc/manganese transport system substrate-binding protein
LYNKTIININNYNQNYDIFVKNWNNSINQWSNEAKKLNGVNLVAHHKDFDYLAQWLKINIVAYLEEKPGVEPTAKYLASVVNNLDNQNVKLIIRAPYSSSSPSHWVSNKANIKNIELPYSLDFNSQNNIFDLYNNILAILLANIG